MRRPLLDNLKAMVYNGIADNYKRLTTKTTLKRPLLHYLEFSLIDEDKKSRL